MSSSDIIATLALLVACLAALYARWSAKASQRANQISIHQPQLSIYLELRRFQDAFRGFESYPSEETLNRFHEQAVVMSEIYFPPAIAKPIAELYWFCRERMARVEGYDNEEGDPHFLGEMEAEFSRLGKAAVSPLLEALKPRIQVYE